MTVTLVFSEIQMQHFAAWKKVQDSNKYNMLDPRARAAMSLDKAQYLFVLENYDAMERQAKEFN